ncbi:hypothetical protein [Flavobacterium cyanobacteriorum]|uniref:hypothetical protein n=1 Tax=Flavobacterium cyanobacteriorum TaxID=2022802 RepID=UPI0013FD30F4|nr:hypothetical protein [Flavobacterium cyanobacteriorum]
MKKIILLLLFVLSASSLNAQEKIIDTEFFRCENKWVLLPAKENDSLTEFV